VDFKTGEATVVPRENTGFDPTGIPEALRKAGFTAGKIRVTAVGTLTKEGEILSLKMDGPLEQLILAGGPGIDDLAKEEKVLGRRLRVKGEFHPSHADKPPGLTVETWQPAIPP